MTADASSVKINISNDPKTSSISKANIDNADFNSQKLLILDLISQISSNLREREKVKRDKSANPLAHIKLANKLETLISSAHDEINVLKSIFTKIKSSKRLRNKYTDSDLEGFNDAINNLCENISTFESSVRYKSSASSKRVKANLDLNDPSGDTKSLTMEDQRQAIESIRRWRERDEGFDKQLQEIGEAVDMIGDMASQIGQTAMDQAKNAIGMVTRVQETTDDISTMSLKIKKMIKRQMLFEFYFRIALIIILLTLVAVFTYLMFSYFRR